MQTYWIYLIGAYHKHKGEPEAVKVGITNDVDARLYSLQTGNHLRLRIIATWKAKGFRDARHIENCTHKAFSKHRMNREWFKPLTERLVDYINTIRVETLPEDKRREVERVMTGIKVEAEEEAAIEALDNQALSELSWLRH